MIMGMSKYQHKSAHSGPYSRGYIRAFRDLQNFFDCSEKGLIDSKVLDSRSFSFFFSLLEAIRTDIDLFAEREGKGISFTIKKDGSVVALFPSEEDARNHSWFRRPGSVIEKFEVVNDKGYKEDWYVETDI